MITIVHATAGTLNITLPIGFYNQNSIVTAMQNGFNTALGAFDTFTVAFNTLNKTISITSNGGLNWFISNQCTFYLYGYNVANFLGYPPSSVVATVGRPAWYSGNAGLLYSRYVAITSNTLCAHAYETSRTSSGYFNTVAIISMVNQYDATDFSVNNVYQGNLMMDSTIETASVLNVAQSGAQIQIVDFQLRDEFGFDLDRAIKLEAPYADSRLGCIIITTFYV